MNENARIEMEDRLQRLLAMELPAPETLVLFEQVIRDDDARRVATEVIDFQAECRRAFGADVTDFDLTALALKCSRTIKKEVPRRGWWMMRVAALLVLSFSIYLAGAMKRDLDQLQKEMVPGKEQAQKAVQSPPQLTNQEVAYLREVWTQVAGDEKNPSWICLTGGRGVFGRVPAASAESGVRGMILLDCVVLRPDGREAEHIRVLAPPYRGSIVLPAVGRLGAEPIQLAVSSLDQWKGIDLTVGTDSEIVGGVRGRAVVGGGQVDVGEFQMNGERMRVLLQAIDLSENPT